MEVETPIAVVSLEYKCDSCQVGHMRPNGVSSPSHPVTYPHVCTSCGHCASLHKRYPDILYRPAELTTGQVN